jgi:HEAT repeat protein
MERIMPAKTRNDGPPLEGEVGLLIESLKRGEAAARWKAVKALSKIGLEAESAIPVLIDALQDKTIIVRVGAAETLSRLGPAAGSAVPALIDALGDKYATVREMAAAALGSIGWVASCAVDSLCGALRDESKYVRTEAAKALVRICTIQNAEAIHSLVAQLGNPAPQVRAGVAGDPADRSPLSTRLVSRSASTEDPIPRSLDLRRV